MPNDEIVEGATRENAHSLSETSPENSSRIQNWVNSQMRPSVSAVPQNSRNVIVRINDKHRLLIEPTQDISNGSHTLSMSNEEARLRIDPQSSDRFQVINSSNGETMYESNLNN